MLSNQKDKIHFKLKIHLNVKVKTRVKQEVKMLKVEKKLVLSYRMSLVTFRMLKLLAMTLLCFSQKITILLNQGPLLSLKKLYQLLFLQEY